MAAGQQAASSVGAARAGSWQRRTAIGLFTILGITLAAAAGAIYQAVGEARDRAAYPMPGAHVDLGEVRLHLHCVGVGGPTVVLSSGMGNPSSAWAPLQDRLGKTARVCAYDRDGLGWSGDSGRPRDAATATDQLHRLLAAANIAPPYIVVGHSYGALVARVYADTYPDNVAGLVLIDSSHEDMGERFPPQAQDGFRDLLAGFRYAPYMNRVGVPRLTGMFAPAVEGLEGEALARSMARLNSVPHMVGTAAEAAGWERSAVRARDVRERGFGDMSLAVFVAGDWPDYMLPSWKEMQRELASLSSRSRYRVIDGANHPQIMMDESFYPEIAETVEEMIAARRGHSVWRGD